MGEVTEATELIAISSLFFIRNTMSGAEKKTYIRH